MQILHLQRFYNQFNKVVPDFDDTRLDGVEPQETHPPCMTGTKTTSSPSLTFVSVPLKTPISCPFTSTSMFDRGSPDRGSISADLSLGSRSTTLATRSTKDTH